MSETGELGSRMEQLETLGLMAAHEAAIGDLYAAYAKALPAHAVLFTKLAEEEKKHARLVAGFADDVRAGLVQVTAGRFSAEAVMNSLDSVRARLEDARQGNITALDALATAAGLEDGLIEKAYFVVVEGDHPDLKQLLDTLASETTGHREKLKEAWEREGG
jgi:rubrerythrin